MSEHLDSSQYPTGLRFYYCQECGQPASQSVHDIPVKLLKCKPCRRADGEHSDAEQLWDALKSIPQRGPA